MKKVFRIIVIAVLLLILLSFFVGPKPEKPKYSRDLPELNIELNDLEAYLADQEKLLPVKPGNKATIVWADDSSKLRTEYAIVYLHGFGACHEEGNPVHRNIAKKFNCNLLLSRLSDHGVESDQPMLELTVDRLWESALKYYAMGKLLGDNVILMSTSTGGTLAILMAATFPEIHSVILYSPNVKVNNQFAWLLNNPWGLQMTRIINGGPEILSENKAPYYTKYWYDQYRLEAAVQLQELIETSMYEETFTKVEQPLLLLYYYKDKIHQDSVVRVDAMLEMFDQLGTPEDQKVKHAIPGAGNHVIGSSFRSGAVDQVETYTEEFFKEILLIQEADQVNK